MDFEKATQTAIASGSETAMTLPLWSKLVLFTFLGAFDEAAKTGAELASFSEESICVSVSALQFLCHGVSILAFPKRSRREAKSYIQRPEIVAKHCKENFQNKVDLLEGELAAYHGNCEQALKKHRESIRLAKSELVQSELGLACERAAAVPQKIGRIFRIHGPHRKSNQGT